ncbi:MAG: GEVED domain-containing protein [bacterium]|nr:GEVED domain-containing protein [bacterium]
MHARPDLYFFEGTISPLNLDSLLSLESPHILGILPQYRPLTSAGSVASEADLVHQTRRVNRSTPSGYDGTDITIGVLSDSYDNLAGAANDIASNDLPASVDVLQDLSAGGSDEGRAMIQLAYDLAPGANFAFATAFTGEAGFAQNILDLADPLKGAADIIVDDVFYFAEPFFQDGIIAQAVDTVVASGVSYFSSAGNAADKSYESTAVSFGVDPQFAGDWLDFDPAGGIDTRQNLTISNSSRIRLALQWDDPFYTANGVDTDLDVYLVEAGTTNIVARAEDFNTTSQVPFEFLDFTNNSGNTSFELLIRKFSGPAPGRLKYINFGDDVPVEYDTNSPTIVGHSASAKAVSVAATFYGDQLVPESFTSLGPSTILFEPDGTPLSSPNIRQTPRLAAVDGTNNTFFGNDYEGDGFPNFFGTSAAAPHAAAIAALVKQANSTFEPNQIYQRLESTARDISTPGFDTLTGAGLVDAYQAVFGAPTSILPNTLDDFEAGVASPAWGFTNSGGARIDVNSIEDPIGVFHLTMDSFFDSAPGLSEAILHVETAGFTDINLTFDFKEFSDEDDPMPAIFTGSTNADGVSLSVDGNSWYRIVELTDAAGNAPPNYVTFGPFNLTALASANGLNLDDGLQVKFQHFDNFPIATDGFTFDNISVNGSFLGTEDFGDAPQASQSGFANDYPTRQIDGGASHTILPGFSLGENIDSESDGQPNLGASADDQAGFVDDEDGVSFGRGLPIGGTGRFTAFVANVANAASNPFLDAWVDFNADGDWLDAGEKIFSGPVLSGENEIFFGVPEWASEGISYARFRLHDGLVGIVPDGPSPAGEVEDHAVLIYDPVRWLSRGPQSISDGQVENVVPDDQVIGAIHTVVAHPSDPDTLWIGSVNGGVWRTSNATSGNPKWTPLTDRQSSLSIGALELDPTDSTNQTIVAGLGRYSSYGQVGDQRRGLLRSTDSGEFWEPLDGNGALVGANVSGVAPRSEFLTVSVNVADNFSCPNVGVFHSQDSGATFSQVLSGVSYDLSGHPNSPAILYSSLVFGEVCGSDSNGIYRSNDSGASWTKVSDAAIDALIIDNQTSNIEISVGAEGEVYAAILNTGNLAGLFRSPNGATGTWVQMETPSTNENGVDVGLNPSGAKGPPAGSPMADIAGGQGSIHFSIRADPTNPSIVYVGGDRQPRSFGDTGGFPNSIGARDFSGRLFRCDASQNIGEQCVHLTHSDSQGATGGGTASNSAPHADSREMVFDAAGDLIEVDDGGIYRRTNPRDNTGDWFSLIGDLGVTEQHDIAYDSISGIVISGNQDTGTTQQSNSTSLQWSSVSTADGGDVAIDDSGTNSFRYSSFQNLSTFTRREYDSSNSLISSVSLQGIDDPHFRTPIELNAVDPTRLIIGGSTAIHERDARGSGSDILVGCAEATCGLTSTNAFFGDPLAYGHASDPNLIVVGSGSQILVRRGGLSELLTPTDTAFPGGTVLDIELDTSEEGSWFVLTNSAVFVTKDFGTTWSELTANLSSLAGDYRSLEHVEGPLEDFLIVSSDEQVFVSKESDDYSVWTRLGGPLPGALIFDTDYDSKDDILAVATMGRGTWALKDVRRLLGGFAPFDIRLDNTAVSENSITGTLVGVFETLDSDFIDEFVYGFAAGDGDDDNTRFQISGNELFLVDQADYELNSTFSIRVRSTDAKDQHLESKFLIEVIDLPEIETVIFGDGTQQRSLVSELTVRFDGPVDIDDNAISLEKRGPDGGNVITEALIENVDEQTIAILTFSGSFTNTAGTLVDGNYLFRIDGSKVSRNGLHLDALQNGETGTELRLGEDEADAFYAFFGDVNGNRFVDPLDSLLFRRSLNKPATEPDYDSRFDINDNDFIDPFDSLLFRRNLNKQLPFV